MNCKKCGSPLSANDQFCKNCGAAANAQEEMIGGQTQMQQNNQSDMSQQPVNIQQPINVQTQPINENSSPNGWQNSYNPTPNFQPQNTNNNGKYILIGIIAVVALFAGFFIFNSSNNDGGNGGGSNYTGGTTKSYKVNFKGFTFTIPDNLVYEQDGSVLLIGDEAGTWVTQLEVEEGSFAQLKSNKNQLPSLMQQNGYTCAAALEKSLGGVDYITMEVTASGQNFIAALAKANAMYFVGITAVNRNNSFDYKLLETIAPIINSAESSSMGTNNMSPNVTVDMSGFSELAK